MTQFLAVKIYIHSWSLYNLIAIEKSYWSKWIRGVWEISELLKGVSRTPRNVKYEKFCSSNWRLKAKPILQNAPS